jgi:hypothetical protein
MLTSEPFQNMNAYRYCFLLELQEKFQGNLKLVTAKAGVKPVIRESGVAEYSQYGSIEVLDEGYEFIFRDYILYSILDESYSKADDPADYVGNTFRIYRKSHLLDYVAKDTTATHDFPGPYQHYCISAEDHIVSVITTVEPEIIKLNEQDLSQFLC